MTYLLQQILKKSTQKFPDKDAVIYQDNRITYQQLDTFSNQLSHVLRKAGIQVGDCVGLCLDKSIEAVIAIYGVLKAGAAYVPMDTAAPNQRIAFFIESCEIKVLITTEKKFAALYHECNQSITKNLQCVILKDTAITGKADVLAGVDVITWQDVVREHDTPLAPFAMTEEYLAYILHTSGSTGKPKGVMLSHRSALTFINSAYECFQVSSNDRIYNQTPVYFSASIFDIFTTIRAGATIIIVPSELAVFPVDLAHYIEKQKITIWYSVPSVLTQLVIRGNLKQHKFPNLRTIMFAGEVFPMKYLEQLKASSPHAKYYNLYGTTETNVCAYYPIPDQLSPHMTSLPLGKATPNTELFAVNEHHEVLAPGEEGELYVRTASKMKGYWKMPEKTKQSLVSHTLKPNIGEELVFRTGDIVKQDASGNYIYLGRRDYMIKILGHRIELGEIEARLYEHPEIEEAIVVAIPDQEIGNRLKAVVSIKENSSTNKNDLQSFCAKRLPKYMIPKIIEFQMTLPKTATGKIDRALLRQIAIQEQQ